MKQIIFFLMLPVIGFSQYNQSQLKAEADTIRHETLRGANTAQRVGRMFVNLNKNLVNGSMITTTGTSGAATFNYSTGVLNIPNYSGGGGITNSAPANVLMKSDGTNAVASSISNFFTDALTTTSAGKLTIFPKLYISTTNSSPGTQATGTLQTTNTNSVTNTIIYPLTVSRFTSGTPTTGIGTGIELETQISAAGSSGSYVIGSIIESVSTTVSGGSSVFDLVFKNMNGGAASEAFRVKADGAIKASKILITSPSPPDVTHSQHDALYWDTSGAGEIIHYVGNGFDGTASNFYIGSLLTLTPISTSFSSDQNNYNVGTGAMVDMSTDNTVTRSLTGLSNGINGRLLIIRNMNTTAVIAFNNEDSGSSAANRIHTSTGATLNLNPGKMLMLTYKTGSLNRWVDISF